jgi:hypothetical protein
MYVFNIAKGSLVYLRKVCANISRMVNDMPFEKSTASKLIIETQVHVGLRTIVQFMIQYCHGSRNRRHNSPRCMIHAMGACRYI